MADYALLYLNANGEYRRIKPRGDSMLALLKEIFNTSDVEVSEEDAVPFAIMYPTVVRKTKARVLLKNFLIDNRFHLRDLEVAPFEVILGRHRIEVGTDIDSIYGISPEELEKLERLWLRGIRDEKREIAFQTIKQRDPNAQPWSYLVDVPVGEFELLVKPIVQPITMDEIQDFDGIEMYDSPNDDDDDVIIPILEKERTATTEVFEDEKGNQSYHSDDDDEDENKSHHSDAYDEFEMTYTGHDIADDPPPTFMQIVKQGAVVKESIALPPPKKPLVLTMWESKNNPFKRKIDTIDINSNDSDEDDESMESNSEDRAFIAPDQEGSETQRYGNSYESSEEDPSFVSNNDNDSSSSSSSSSGEHKYELVRKCYCTCKCPGCKTSRHITHPPHKKRKLSSDE